jgi:hypothetical protein
MPMLGRPIEPSMCEGVAPWWRAVGASEGVSGLVAAR